MHENSKHQIQSLGAPAGLRVGWGRSPGCACHVLFLKLSCGEWRWCLIPYFLYTLNISLVKKQSTFLLLGFPGVSNGEEPACNAGDPGSVPGGGNGNPLQNSCLENSMERSLVSCSLWGRRESDTTERLKG